MRVGSTSFDELAAWRRFAAGLPGYLRERISLEEAEATVRRRLETRGDAFVRLVREAVFGHPASPFLPLFELAGCTAGDVEREVAAHGLDATLERLRQAGVYVTFEEVKGRRPLVRGGREVPIGPRSFDHPHLAAWYAGTTSGSTGAPYRAIVDLDLLRDRGPQVMLSHEALGVLGAPSCHWRPILPSIPGLTLQLLDLRFGTVAERWYTPVSAAELGSTLKDRLATAAVVGVARASGVPFPRPRRLPLERAVEIARWAAGAVRRRGACRVRSTVSCAVRVAAAAREAGIDLTGATLLGGGEPTTAARRRTVRASGARFFTTYGMVDVGGVGVPCAHAEDDQHVLEDGVALITAPHPVPGSAMTVDAFYLTPLLPSTPRVLINYQCDDFGIVERRPCGCRLERAGYRRHVRGIGSLGKLCGEGVTLVGSDMIRILEESLPARFGGGPTDFQLVEEEGDDGLIRLWLDVHPRLELDEPEDAIVRTVYRELERSDAAGGLARAVWRGAGTLRVRRRAPEWNRHGKFQSLRTLGVSRTGGSSSRAG